ncbi:MAG: hypothetical protein KME07_19795 [Pegethrix bostrychoides GSE-TBD4-15B]|jgi:hypothetical protein|uniref:Uncharacterized protein n=1 Tax=Pegethrix bostrychoides GSE-TBD4-15B TaxID=2839662 RepID=A0A951PDM6_9CYAN|nr:hypothetical protein [Pegethrix bostrychoides GSE-TBD4-15B]
MARQLQSGRGSAGKSSHKSSGRPRRLWFEQVMAALALLNLLLVLFDLSYIPWRDFYLRHLPQLTQWYGERFKGIEPHRLIEAYLTAVQELETQVDLTGVQSPEVLPKLAQLQELSLDLITENPFAASDKSGTLERIKNRVRRQVGLQSSKAAFAQFWTQDYLTQAGWESSMQFFQSEIEPLLATAYYRNIGENGKFIDHFWQLDLWFVGLFAAEFVIRTLYLKRRYQQAWLDTVIWRSYDLLLLLPFWRWLRLIPVVIRLDQSRLVNFQPLERRILRGLIATVAVELTEMVVLRLIDQAQELIRRGEVTRWLLRSRYIDLNGVNEVEAIAKQFSDLLIYQVLPKVQPELEALLTHSVTQILGRSPVYAGLQNLPGVSAASNSLTQQLVADLSKNAYEAIRSALEDETGAVLLRRLVGQLGDSLSAELKQSQAADEIQALTIALLDEVKVNYVERIAATDHAELQAQSGRLYRIAQNRAAQDQASE